MSKLILTGEAGRWMVQFRRDDRRPQQLESMTGRSAGQKPGMKAILGQWEEVPTGSIEGLDAFNAGGEQPGQLRPLHARRHRVTIG